MQGSPVHLSLCVFQRLSTWRGLYDFLQQLLVPVDASLLLLDSMCLP